MENKRHKRKTSNVVSFIPNGDYYYNKALKALDRDEMDKAYKYIKRAADLSPDDAHILLQYGILEMELQNFEHAYELVHTAYSLDPNESEIVFMLAELSGCMGMLQDAHNYASKYIQMDPDGMYILEANEILQFVEAEQVAFEEFDEADSEKMIVQEKARRLMEQGQFEKAIEILEQAIERFPQLWNAYNNLALAYFYIGETEQAKALLNEVLRENHGNLHALCNLAVFAYYEKDTKKLEQFLEMLKKIQPYEWENRYKLGATLALIAEYEEAFKWLYSMRKRGYEGDPGYYFWLAQASYFSGHEHIAQAAWKSLIEMDPSKEGFEPWANNENGKFRKSVENHREFLIRKLSEKATADKLLGLFLLKISAHKQEIIAHPDMVNVDTLTGLEKLGLAYALEYDFDGKNEDENRFLRYMQVGEAIVSQASSITLETAQILSVWMNIGEIAITNGFQFKNTKALAAAMEYLYASATSDEKVTKKYYADKYEVSVATLTKFEQQLDQYIPNDEASN